MTKPMKDVIERFIQAWLALEDEPHPVPCTTDKRELQKLHELLPRQLPPLFEELLANFRWEEVYFDNFRLLPNPGIEGFAAEIVEDRFLSKVLLANGLIQFARAVDGAAYDPICFDVRDNKKEYPIVRVDHEEALIRDRLKILSVVAPSFEALLMSVVATTKKDGENAH